MPLQTPIAFCIFNRPELTRQVFAAIAAAQPNQLFVISDGPRDDRPAERELVAQSRSVLNAIDWDCDLKTNFSDVNLGCKRRMASGLDWAFDQSDELIILEDDCLPAPSFFPFCENLLQKYRDDQRVMMISGDNFQPAPRTPHSYYFSRWSHIWGWASWKRAWQHFDVDVATWPEVKSSQQLMSLFGSGVEYRHWESILDQQHAGSIDTWDFPWAYACWTNSGLTVLPETNLVSNLGFGPTATHTLDAQSRLANLTTGTLTELNHPSRVASNHIADQYTWENILAPPNLSTATVEKTKWYQRFASKKSA